MKVRYSIVVIVSIVVIGLFTCLWMGFEENDTPQKSGYESTVENQSREGGNGSQPTDGNRLLDGAPDVSFREGIEYADIDNSTNDGETESAQREESEEGSSSQIDGPSLSGNELPIIR